MGDEKYYSIQIKGVAYRFRPMPPEDLERVMMVNSLNLSHLRVLKVLTRVLATAAGPEQWDAITDRYMNQDISLAEMTVDVFRKLVKRQGKDHVQDVPVPASDDDDDDEE